MSLNTPPHSPTLVSEEASQKELSSTVVARRVAIVLSLSFLSLLLLPAFVQLLAPTTSGLLIPVNASLFSTQTFRNLEKELDKRNLLKSKVQPALQSLLSSLGGFGNEKVTIGRQGWLYYSPGLQYSFGFPFLDPGHLERKTKSSVNSGEAEATHANPLPAFLQLAADCRSWGIQLVLAPIPDKGMMVPEYLGSAADPNSLQNSDFARFAAALEAAGAVVFRAEPVARGLAGPTYLKQDTHWTPPYMTAVARSLAADIRSRPGLEPAGQTKLYRRTQRSSSHFGDLVGMLGLPVDQAQYPPQSVTIEPIVDAQSGNPLQFNQAATVLLAGDSFSNIYSEASLQWGEHAGFGQHLAFHLNAPIDVLAVNGAAATAVRQELIRASRSGRMQNTQVLVYQFAVRDLYLAHWPPLPFGSPPVRRVTQAAPAAQPMAPDVKLSTPPPSKEVVLTGMITQLSRPLDPAAAPYEDGLWFGTIRVERVISGTYANKSAILVFLAMRNRQLLSGSRHQVGERVTVRITPMRSAPPEVQGFQRSDDTDNYDLLPQFVLEELKQP